MERPRAWGSKPILLEQGPSPLGERTDILYPGIQLQTRGLANSHASSMVKPVKPTARVGSSDFGAVPLLIADLRGLKARLQVPLPAWRPTTEFASRIARPSSPVFSKRSLATFAQSSLNSGVTAL
jgi:hypothetical protein